VKLVLASLVGLALFAWPFAGGRAPAVTPALALAGGTVVALVLVEVGSRRLDARGLALLATLAAIDSALRLALVVGIGGFSPVFFLILCAGYVFGASYGFLTGAVCLLVSALVTGGIGPWLPYQMFAAGWMGAAGGLAGGRLAGPPSRGDLMVLSAVGFAGGYVFGALMDLSIWSLPGIIWAPGWPALEVARRFLFLYLATSIWYDSLRAAGNVIMVLAFGAPVLAALARLRARMTFEIVPREEAPAQP
jgi:energy-coupling factor transport system substrate-specific component